MARACRARVEQQRGQPEATFDHDLSGDGGPQAQTQAYVKARRERHVGAVADDIQHQWLRTAAASIHPPRAEWRILHALANKAAHTRFVARLWLHATFVAM